MATKDVQIKNLKISSVDILIEGISPLIVNRFSDLTAQKLEDDHMGKAKNSKHDILDPEKQWQSAKHISSDGWEGYPAVGFKAAMVRAAKIIGMVMKDTQTAFFVLADDPITQLVKIIGTSKMRRDVVRLSNGAPDLRYRPEYTQWSTVLHIEYNEGVLNHNQIFQLVMAAGYGSGIGEMRPEKTKYAYGRWKINKT